VPMNALLQHRGHNLMGAGRSIAVQNFNENSSILLMIACYSLLLGSGVSITWIIILFGFFVAGTMAMVQRWFNLNRITHATEIDRLLEIAKSEKH
jgi:LPLT family lysophospholipid transporter-like MFS transporter